MNKNTEHNRKKVHTTKKNKKENIKLLIKLLILMTTINPKPHRRPLCRESTEFTGARDSEWQWHQLGHMQICTLTQTHNHTSIPQLSFLQAGCPSCRPTNSIKALKA